MFEIVESHSDSIIESIWLESVKVYFTEKTHLGSYLVGKGFQ